MARRIIKSAIILLITSGFIVTVSIFVKNILIFQEKLKTKVSEVNIVRVKGEFYESSLFAISAFEVRSLETIPMVGICECSRRSRYNSSVGSSCQFLEFPLQLGNRTTGVMTQELTNIMVVESPSNFAIREYVNITCWSRLEMRYILLTASISVIHAISCQSELVLKF